MSSIPLNSAPRHVWADVIRIIAISCVVFIHSGNIELWQGEISAIKWYIFTALDVAAHIGVPLFIMLSGALLLVKNESAYDFFRKKFKRIIVPFMFWIIIFVLFKQYYDSYYNEDFYHQDFESVKKIVISIYTGKLYYHLWFMNVLVGIYLFVPFIRKFVQNAVFHDFKYYFVLWLIFASIIPAVNSLFNSELNISLYNYTWQYFPFFTGFLGYFLLGYIITNYNFNRYQLIIGVVVFIVGLIIAVVIPNTYMELEVVDLSPSVIMMSVPAFIFIRNMASKYASSLSITAQKIIEKLSKATFGVYFIHVIFLRFLQEGVFFGLRSHDMIYNPSVAIPLTFISALILSYTTILLLMKIPVLNKLIT